MRAPAWLHHHARYCWSSQWVASRSPVNFLWGYVNAVFGFLANIVVAPVLELGRVRFLADRGHRVEFATLGGQEKWSNDYPFISRTHSMGPRPSGAEYDAHFLRMRGWDAKKGFADAMDSKYLFDSYWTDIPTPESYCRG